MILCSCGNRGLAWNEGLAALRNPDEMTIGAADPIWALSDLSGRFFLGKSWRTPPDYIIGGPKPFRDICSTRARTCQRRLHQMSQLNMTIHRRRSSKPNSRLPFLRLSHWSPFESVGFPLEGHALLEESNSMEPRPPDGDS